MSSVLDLIRQVEREEHELRELYEHLKRLFCCPQKPDSGRFAGFHYINAKGEIIVAAQQIPVNTPSTTNLIFTLAGVPITGPGPIGSVTSSDPSVSAALSTDGQFANVTLNQPNVTSTITWSGDGANGPFSFSVDVTDQPVVTLPDGGSFGTFAPGTTA